jgi:hypothetical protein
MCPAGPAARLARRGSRDSPQSGSSGPVPAGIHHHTEETMERSRPDALGDFFVVSTEWDTWCVSTEMARHIDACLETDPLPRWLTFVDVTGARVRLRADSVESLTQRSIEQRAVGRRFERQARDERRMDGLVAEEE